MSGKKIEAEVEHAKATDLISRLAAGERWPGDNAEVMLALGRSPIIDIVRNGEMGRYEVRPLDSLDDALALVPEGWRTEAATEDEDGTWLWPLMEWETLRLEAGRAPTPAVALCIAILRAGESND